MKTLARNGGCRPNRVAALPHTARRNDPAVHGAIDVTGAGTGVRFA